MTRDPGRIKYLTQEQARAFFAAIPTKNRRDRLMFAFAYRYGLRACEVVGLPADAVDKRSRTVRIQGAKGGRLAVYRVWSDLWPLVKKWQPGPLTYFYGRQGPLSRKQLWGLFKDYARAAGLPKELSPHALRHSAAVHCLDAGGATEDAADLLRHADLRTTRIYAALSTRRRNDYQRRLEESPAVVKLPR